MRLMYRPILIQVIALVEGFGINQGKIPLVRWRIKVRKKRDLFVKQSMIGGSMEIGEWNRNLHAGGNDVTDQNVGGY